MGKAISPEAALSPLCLKPIQASTLPTSRDEPGYNKLKDSLMTHAGLLVKSLMDGPAGPWKVNKVYTPAYSDRHGKRQDLSITTKRASNPAGSGLDDVNTRWFSRQSRHEGDYESFAQGLLRVSPALLPL